MIAARQIEAVPIASIAIGERVGFYCADHAEQLGADMKRNGQHDPIHLRRNGNANTQHRWTLVAGLHRLRGAELAGFATVDSVQVADASSTLAELRQLELSENLDHRQRRPMERAIIVAARAALEEEVNHPGRVGETPQERAARARWDASATMADASEWRERTAIAIGCGLRTLERLQRIHRTIVQALPDLAEPLNFHPLGESLSAVMQIVGLKQDDTRRKAVLAVLSKPDWPNVQAALAAHGLHDGTGNRADSDRHGAAMIAAWGQMPLRDRKAHCQWLVHNITPGMATDMVEGFKRRGLLP